MKAMLLAAGKGERMLPLTLTLPKPAIPVLGEALAGHILGRLAAGGVTEATVNLHHLPDLVRMVIGEGDRYGLDVIHYSLEEKRILGTGGGLRHAARFLGRSGPFVVHNADFLSDIDLAAALETHRTSGSLATLVLAPGRPGYTPVIAGSDRVLAIGDRPRPAEGRSCLFTGCHLVEPEILDRLPEGPCDIVRDLYYEMIGAGELGYHLHEGWWWEFGNPGALLDGTLRLIDLPRKKLDRLCAFDPIRPIGQARVAVGEGADFHVAVGLTGRVALGAATRVGEGSYLEETVVMPEAWIGPGSRLKRVVVAPELELPAGFEAENVLICSDPEPSGDPPPGCDRRGGFLVRPVTP
jgi:NDP-sugar pyrophosphorylase family protein